MSVLELDIKAISEDEEENMRLNDTNITEDREGTNMIQTLSSSGPTPGPFKTNAERRTQSSGASKEQDVDALEIIQETEEMSSSSESEKNKPWMKVGANISDYFNYGFDEESWDAYCKKQATLCDVNGKLFPKLLPQMWNTGNEEEQPCCAYSSFDRPASRINRASNATSDVSVGQPGLSSRKEGRQCLSHGNSAEVVTEMSHKADLSPPSNTNSLFADTSPPLILCQSGPPASSPTSILNRGHLKDMDSALTSLYPQSSESMAVSVGMIDTAKAWDYMWQQECDKCRDKSREQGRDKGRNRKKESSSSSHNSGEEQLKHRDTAERGHKRRSFEKISGEKRHKSEGWHKTSQSNSRSRSRSSSSRRNRKDDGEDRDSRHKHKGQEK